MTVAIDVRDVSVQHRDVRALDGASLSVEHGRICALIGMNGSGKSTLFKAIMGLVTLTTGTVTLAGTDSASVRRAGEVAYVPQSEEIDWSFPVSVRDVVMMGRYARLGMTRRPRPEDHEAVDRALARVELTGLQRRQIGALSGGQRKRAFVARGLAQGATILLLDEPFTGVDNPSEALIVRELRATAAAGAAVLISTHDLAAVPELADDAALLMKRILAHGPPEQILQPDVLALAFGLGQEGPV